MCSVENQQDLMDFNITTMKANQRGAETRILQKGTVSISFHKLQISAIFHWSVWRLVRLREFRPIHTSRPL